MPIRGDRVTLSVVWNAPLPAAAAAEPLQHFEACVMPEDAAAAAVNLPVAAAPSEEPISIVVDSDAAGALVRENTPPLHSSPEAQLDAMDFQASDLWEAYKLYYMLQYSKRQRELTALKACKFGLIFVGTYGERRLTQRNFNQLYALASAHVAERFGDDAATLRSLVESRPTTELDHIQRTSPSFFEAMRREIESERSRDADLKEFMATPPELSADAHASPLKPGEAEELDVNFYLY